MTGILPANLRFLPHSEIRAYAMWFLIIVIGRTAIDYYDDRRGLNLSKVLIRHGIYAALLLGLCAF